MITRRGILVVGVSAALSKPLTYAKIPVEPAPSPEDFDAPANGQDDDGPAFRRAMDHLSSTGGGTLYLSTGKRYSCQSPVTIPDNCGIDGGLLSPGFVAGLDYRKQASSLLLDPRASLSLGNSTGLRNLRILNAALQYPCPETEAGARAHVDEFAGTAITDSENSADRHIENVLVIGFNQAIKLVSNQGRAIIKDFRFDCRNGIEIANSQDVDSLENCLGSDFYMQGRKFNWKAIYRDGTAFSFHHSQDGPYLVNCFEIGYKLGYAFEKTLSPRLTNCDCDGAADLTLTNLTGLQFTDAGNASIVGGNITNQWRAVSVISGGQHAFIGVTIGNQAVAPDGYLLRAAGGSVGRVVGCFFVASPKGGDQNPISFVNKAGQWTGTHNQFFGFRARPVAAEQGVPSPDFR